VVHRWFGRRCTEPRRRRAGRACRSAGSYGFTWRGAVARSGHPV